MAFSLQQFSAVFKIRDEAGQPYVLVGGQAVNYWAEHYLSQEPELKSLRPFAEQNLVVLELVQLTVERLDLLHLVFDHGDEFC